jgi:tRNA threonylcarbamoyladenosine biosynthesis protein TsaE
MLPIIYELRKLEDLNFIVEEFCRDNLKIPALILLNGDLGAGKTTFTKALVHKLNPEIKVLSPTFSRIHEYENESYKIYHIDAYRVSPSIDELEELLENNNALLIIEWPEMIDNLQDIFCYFGANIFNLEFALKKDDHRTLIINKIE